MRLRFPLLVAAVCLAQVAWAGDPKNDDAGKRAFKAGVNLVNDPDGARYDEALVEFKRAYRLLSNWKILGNIGLCALKVERDGEAIEAYEQYLRDGGKDIDAVEREQIEKDLLSLKTRLVKVHLEFATVGGTLFDERVGSKFLNEYPIGGRTLDLGLHPGHHVLTVRTAAGEERWEASLPSGEQLTHTFGSPKAPVASVPPTPDKAAPRRGSQQATTGLVIGAVGVVGLGVGTALGFAAKSKYHESDGHCDPSGCDEAGLDATNQGRKTATVATIVFGAGAAAALGGAVLWLTAPKGEKKASTGTPMLGIGPSGVFVRGAL